MHASFSYLNKIITDRKFGVDDGAFNPTSGAKTSATLDGQVDFYIALIHSYADYDPVNFVASFGGGVEEITEMTKIQALDYLNSFNTPK